MLSYGLRRGEVLGLAWADLYRRRHTLEVRQAVRRRKSSRKGKEGTYLGERENRVELAELKARRSRRVLFLTDPRSARLSSRVPGSGPASGQGFVGSITG